MHLEIIGNDLICHVANKCQDVLERVEVVERNKNGLFSLPAACRIVSVCERKPWYIQKKNVIETLHQKILHYDSLKDSAKVKTSTIINIHHVQAAPWSVQPMQLKLKY